MNDDKEKSFNIMIIGSYYVGKTYFLDKYINNINNRDAIKTKNITIREQNIKLKFKEEKYISLKNLEDYHFNKANGVILVYDVTYLPSLSDIKILLPKIDNYLDDDAKKCKILVACKSDTSYRAVSEEQGKNLSIEYKLPFFETSAYKNCNVTEVFEFLANKISRLKENEDDLLLY